MNYSNIPRKTSKPDRGVTMIRPVIISMLMTIFKYAYLISLKRNITKTNLMKTCMYIPFDNDIISSFNIETFVKPY